MKMNLQSILLGVCFIVCYFTSVSLSAVFISVNMKSEQGCHIENIVDNFPQSIDEGNGTIGNYVGCKIKLRLSDDSEIDLNGGEIFSGNEYIITQAESGIQQFENIMYILIPYYDFDGEIRRSIKDYTYYHSVLTLDYPPQKPIIKR